MLRFVKFLVVLVAVAAMPACGGSSGPASPSVPSPVIAATPAPIVPSPTPAPTPAPTPEATPTPTPAPPSPTTLRRASLSGAAGHKASGSVAIVRTGSSVNLVFQSDFQIDGGVSDVILSTRPDSMDGGMNLGELRALGGAQSYAMRNDGSDFRYVILWCRPFRVVIAVGELR